jgi:hypothetical protein
MGGRRESKIDPAPIVRAHLATLIDAASRRRRLQDYIEQYLTPLAVGLGAWWLDITISAGTGAAILTLAGLFAAFLFQLIIQLLDRAAGWAEIRPAPGPATSRHALLLGELSANAAYASLVAAVTACLSLGVAVTSAGWEERLLGALTLGMLAHLGTTLMMVTRRVYLLTVRRLSDVRTGVHREAA